MKKQAIEVLMFGKWLLLYAMVAVLVISCSQTHKQGVLVNASKDSKVGIISTILNDTTNFYYINFEKYPKPMQQLPVGVFDSGTGGLTVLDAIVNFDQHNNNTRENGSDGLNDFDNESFIYLGDQANMPYGNYSEENKIELLKEHIIKDAQFLLSNKYYESREDTLFKEDKQPVKVIVVACNTATAYGKSHIEDFLSKAGSNIKVIGVIDAGVRGALQTLGKEEDAIIGVLATAGTVSSKGYKRTIEALSKQQGYSGSIEVFQQGGVGIAEAVDEVKDYFIKGLSALREGYKGPGLSSDLKIDKTLLNVYNFNYENSKMLCDKSNPDDCTVMQINDPENYVRYHLVSLMENIRKSDTNKQLKTIILGCTHYPYLTKEIRQVLSELYNYKSKEGEFIYRKNMSENIVLIDPAVNTAKELYEYLSRENLMSSSGDIHKSEFYISVTNVDNKNNLIDSQGDFPYEYKYGREAGNIQEYVKIVPFSRRNISTDILNRFHEQMPFVYNLIQDFEKSNNKTKHLEKKDQI